MMMNSNLKHVLILFIGITLFVSCEPEKPKKVLDDKPVAADEPPIEEIQFTVVKKHPHDVTSFTEGFLFQDGKLFESTGATKELPFTRSLFGIVDLKSGKIDVKAEIDKNLYFGEGILILKGKIFQLTYKNQTAFIYDAKTFKSIGQFKYTNREGWGLTTDGKSIIMSDGTSYLTYLDPDSFTVTKVLSVKESSYDLINLNELEYIDGFIYANIYTTSYIVKIDPKTGKVVGKMNLEPLLNESRTINQNSLETNGIAYDSVSKKIMVTGKLWPTIYEISMIPPQNK
jgi:glutamine cyclotransferase